MSDVYRKDGRPDRLVDTEAERTAAVWDGFKLVKPEAQAEKGKSNTGGGNQSADARNKPTN